MKGTTIFAGAIAMFAGMATAHIHPNMQRHIGCHRGVRRAGLKCKPGDSIHVKREENDRFHVVVKDAQGNEIALPELEDIFDD